MDYKIAHRVFKILVIYITCPSTNHSKWSHLIYQGV